MPAATCSFDSLDLMKPWFKDTCILPVKVMLYLPVSSLLPAGLFCSLSACSFSMLVLELTWWYRELSATAAKRSDALLPSWFDCVKSVWRAGRRASAKAKDRGGDKQPLCRARGSPWFQQRMKAAGADHVFAEASWPSPVSQGQDLLGALNYFFLPRGQRNPRTSKKSFSKLMAGGYASHLCYLAFCGQNKDSCTQQPAKAP